MISDSTPRGNIAAALRADLQVAALTVERLVHVFSDIADDYPAIRRMVDDLANVRQDVDEALKGLKGGQQ